MTENLSLINPVNFSVKNQVQYDSNKFKNEKVNNYLIFKIFSNVNSFKYYLTL
jgi:hypothetical protein